MELDGDKPRASLYPRVLVRTDSPVDNSGSPTFPPKVVGDPRPEVEKADKWKQSGDSMPQGEGRNKMKRIIFFLNHSFSRWYFSFQSIILVKLHNFMLSPCLPVVGGNSQGQGLNENTKGFNVKAGAVVANVRDGPNTSVSAKISKGGNSSTVTSLGNPSFAGVDFKGGIVLKLPFILNAFVSNRSFFVLS